MRGDKGVIMSPNYPNNYDSNDDCGWLVQVDRSHVVELMFEVRHLLTIGRFLVKPKNVIPSLGIMLLSV